MLLRNTIVVLQGLKNYDYSQAGAYFITIYTHNKECLFGDVIDGEMLLNKWGNVVEDCWNELPSHFKHVGLDAFVIMPNHVHGIIIIADYPHVGAGLPRPHCVPGRH